MNVLTAAVGLGFLWIPGIWNLDEPNIAMMVLTQWLGEWSIFISFSIVADSAAGLVFQFFAPLLPFVILTRPINLRAWDGIIIVFFIWAADCGTFGQPILDSLQRNLWPR